LYTVKPAYNGISKNRTIPLQTWTGLYGSSRLRLPKILENLHMKVISISVLRTGRLYPFQVIFLIFFSGRS
jgi:hypothetical protein